MIFKHTIQLHYFYALCIKENITIYNIYFLCVAEDQIASMPQKQLLKRIN